MGGQQAGVRQARWSVDGVAGRVVVRLASARWFSTIAPLVFPRVDRFAHRLTRGRWIPSDGFTPGIVLTTTGARTGKTRLTPVAGISVAGELHVVGSNYGRPGHPAWTANLLAEPSARVSFRGDEHDVRARLLSSDEKAAVWPDLVAIWPAFDAYTQRSGRDLRVFRLDRCER